MGALAVLGVVLLSYSLAALARRAIPIVAAIGASWAGYQFHLDWAALAAMAVTMLAIASLTLDLLCADPAFARAVAVTEVLAAALMMTLAGYALFGSSGVKGAALLHQWPSKDSQSPNACGDPPAVWR